MEVSTSPLVFREQPELKGPRLVAAWGCIGGVGLQAVSYLRGKLGATEFAHILPHDFFPVAASVSDGLVRLSFPESKFYYWKGRGRGDLIIFTADAEPPQGRYHYAHLLLEVAERYEVTTIYTVCAFPASISHAGVPRVLGVVNHADLLAQVKRYRVSPMGDRKLTSMNALLLSIARERRMKGIYLLAEVPSYATKMVNPRSSKAVLEVLAPMLEVAVDLAEMDQMVAEAEEGLARRAQEASWEFLDQFTIDYRDLLGGGEEQQE